MADSDEEHDKRNIREKFRPERSDYERRSDDRRGREPWEDRFSASSFCVLMLHFSNRTVVIFNSFNELELVLIVFSKLYILILKQVTLTFDLDLQCFDTVRIYLFHTSSPWTLFIPKDYLYGLFPRPFDTVGRQEGHPTCKKWGNDGGGHLLVWMEWRPARWSVSASVNLPLHHKV